MASLTDNLNDPNYTPRVIGGAPQGDMIGGLANVGANLLKIFDNSGSSTRTTKANDTALDEAAMGIFQEGTGIELSNPAKDDLVFAERLEKAKKAGTMDATTYDIRMQGVFADVMRKYPNEASDIAAYAKQQGIQHHLFREMDDANKKADALVDEGIAQQNNLVTYATEKGLWDPRTGDRNQAINDALVHRAEATNAAARQAAYENLKQNFDFNNPQHVAYLKQYQQETTNDIGNEIDVRANGALIEISTLLEQAGEDPEKLKMIDQLFDEAIAGTTMFGEQVGQYMRAQKLSGTSDVGMPFDIGFDVDSQKRIEDLIARKKAIFTEMRGYDTEKKKRVIESMKLNSSLTAKQVFPTINALIDATGGSISNVMEWMAYPDKYGLTDNDVKYLQTEFSNGVTDLTETSAQNIAKARAAMQAPEASSNPNLSVPAVLQSAKFLKIATAQINNNAFASDNDRIAALGQYEQSMVGLTFMANKVYMPNNINLENAKSASGLLLNKGVFDQIDKYQTAGGDPEIAELLQSQLTIAGANFTSTLVRKGTEEGRVTYDPLQRKFVASSNPRDLSSVGAAEFETGGMAMILQNNAMQATNNNYANTLNNYLDFMEFASTKTEMIPKDLAVASRVNIRDFLAKGMDLEQITTAMSRMAQQNSEVPTADEMFNKAVDAFNFDTQVPEEWMNGARQTGGENPFDSAEAWNTYRDGLRGDESGGNNDARPINKKTGQADSSALGPDQFIDETWMKFAQDEDWAQGLSREDILKRRTDPVISEKILQEFTADNGRIMSKELDRKPTAEELRLAHFSGPHGAVQVLQADNSAKIDTVLTDAKKAKDPSHTNFRLFYSGVDQEGKPIPRTVGEYMKQFGVK